MPEPIYLSVGTLFAIGTHMRRINDMPNVLRRNIRELDAHYVDVMASDAKARAPRGDTGKLVNGIKGGMDDDTAVFSAEAVSDKGEHEDYARFVEYGHSSGLLSENFDHQDPNDALPVRSKKSYHGGKVTGDPFFHPAAFGPLQERAAAVQDLLVSIVKTINFME